MKIADHELDLSKKIVIFVCFEWKMIISIACGKEQKVFSSCNFYNLGQIFKQPSGIPLLGCDMILNLCIEPNLNLIIINIKAFAL